MVRASRSRENMEKEFKKKTVVCLSTKVDVFEVSDSQIWKNEDVVKEAKLLLLQQEAAGKEPDTDQVLAIAQENMERRLTTTGMAGKSAIVKVILIYFTFKHSACRC